MPAKLPSSLIMVNPHVNETPTLSVAPKIIPIPHDVAVQIKSSANITNLTSVVLGLVRNSLDASARSIKIDVSFSRGDCVVEDNGHGIAAAEFEETGALGKPYWTSKIEGRPGCFGRQGIFLFSLSSLAVLSILSRRQGFQRIGEIDFHRANVLNRSVSASPSYDPDFGESGTRVRVRNLFGDMPVRVKQRAFQDQRFEDEEWAVLMRELVQLLLAWHNPVEITLRASNGTKKFQTRFKGSAAESDSSTMARLSSPQVNINLLLHTLTQAGYIEPNSWSSWVPVSGKTSSVSVKGAISLDPAAHKRTQFVSFGIHPISTNSGLSEICEDINRLFSQSTFGLVVEDCIVDEDELARRRKDRRFKQDGPTIKQTKGGRKGIDRWPMFYLRITTKDALVALTFDENKAEVCQPRIQDVLEIINAMILRWLSEHHFSSRESKKERTEEFWKVQKASDSVCSDKSIKRYGKLNEKELKSSIIDSTSAKTGITPHDFSNWSRMKRGSFVSMDHKMSSNVSMEAAKLQSQSANPNLEGLSLPSRVESSVVQDVPDELGTEHQLSPDDDLVRPSVLIEAQRQSDTEALAHCSYDNKDQLLDQSIPWMHPTSNRAYQVDNRCGCVETLDNLPEDHRRRESLKEAIGNMSSPKAVQSSADKLSTKDRTWIREFLDKWENPVFQTTERPIPEMKLLETPKDDPTIRQRRRITESVGMVGRVQTRSHTLLASRLRKAEVVAQVDQKFILVKMIYAPGDNLDKNPRPSNHEQVLAIIDQHAADERCKVEAFLNDLCQPGKLDNVPLSSNLGLGSPIKAIALRKPVHFHTVAEEGALLRQHASYFAKWGILYNLHEQNEEPANAKCKVVVTALPPSIAERCTLEPKLIVESLRSEIWKRAETRSSLARHENNVEEFDNEQNGHVWLRQISDCPQFIIDMLNSRACRSAIMFNDTLSLDACKDLVDRLVKCALPFQCAHGRPSMVHLADLGDVLDCYSNSVHAICQNEPRDSFVRALKKWQNQKHQAPTL